MNKLLPIFAVSLLGILIWSCERPEAPDFQLNQNMEVPFSLEKKYKLLGIDDALIDTLGDNYLDSLDIDIMTDTVQANLSTFPNKEDNPYLNKGNLIFKYENGIPSNIELSLVFLDEKGNTLFEKPKNFEERYIIKAYSGKTDSMNFKKGKVNMFFFDSQLNSLYKTRSMVFKFNLQSVDKLNLSDFSESGIRFELDLDANFTTTVN